MLKIILIVIISLGILGVLGYSTYLILKKYGNIKWNIL